MDDIFKWLILADQQASFFFLIKLLVPLKSKMLLLNREWI